MATLFVDLETTSVREPWLPGGRQIWQVAVIRREDDGRETAYNRFVRLDELDLSAATERALEISRFHRHPSLNGSEQDVSSGREVAELMVELTADEPLWVGAAPWMDATDVLHLMHLNGLVADDAADVPWDFRLVCVISQLLGRTNLPPTADVGEMSAAVGIDQSSYAIHDALADTYFVRDVFDALNRPN
ncbi:hypothetical protein EV649_0654 [Kribbella sp. VKM Ac-2569]|uniref:hypothetical protein n=1 Tax=Kribbella sp. VKM Ac-2569 TaxID=2512220 RepID=UPI00102B72C0|nr:hypothetical protein [Kribbella sp. VKM Ac-2569]RZT26906.1 hypothetical protein EV649_0654 [Kribbella sp. VKM Ac-2569]